MRLVVIFLSLVVVSKAASPAIARADTIQIFAEELHPFQYLDDNKRLTGYSVEVVEALMSISGDAYKVTLMPWARAYKTVQTTPDALLISVARSQEREQDFDWVGNLRDERLFLWGFKETFSEPVDDISQLVKYDIATTIGSSHDQYLQSIDFPGNYRAVDVEHGMMMLKQKRVHLIFGSAAGMKDRCMRIGITFDSLRPVLEIKALQTELSIALNTDSAPELLNRLVIAFELLQNNGQLTQLQKKWHVEP